MTQGLFFQFHFYLFGLIAVASAVIFVTRKSPVAAAIWLVNVMFSLAALYVMLDAQFIAAIQVLVYAGAIMVVFLFVVMLLNLGHGSEATDLRGKRGGLIALFVGLILLAELLVMQRGRLPQIETPLTRRDAVISSVAEPLFAPGGYLLAFEVTSVLLLVAIVGAVVMAKRRV